MNVELNVSVKFKAADENAGAESQAETRKPSSVVADVFGKIASHPCFAFLVREVMRSS